eukprot:2124656-Heterocapsa_arctica.AAC.1
MQQPAEPDMHSKAFSAGQNIIVILEVRESDFAANFTKEETEEEDALTQYEKMAQDVKYKTQAYRDHEHGAHYRPPLGIEASPHVHAIKVLVEVEVVVGLPGL